MLQNLGNKTSLHIAIENENDSTFRVFKFVKINSNKSFKIASIKNVSFILKYSEMIKLYTHLREF